MEPEGSLPHSQIPATCPYPEPDRSSPSPTSYFLKIDLNIILPSTTGSFKLYLGFINSNNFCVTSGRPKKIPLLNNPLRQGSCVNNLMLSSYIPISNRSFGNVDHMNPKISDTPAYSCLIFWHERRFKF